MLSTGKLPLGGLPKNSVARITDRPEMNSAVYHGHKATNQSINTYNLRKKHLYIVCNIVLTVKKAEIRLPKLKSIPFILSLFVKCFQNLEFLFLKKGSWTGYRLDELIQLVEMGLVSNIVPVLIISTML